MQQNPRDQERGSPIKQLACMALQQHAGASSVSSQAAWQTCNGMVQQAGSSPSGRQSQACGR